MTITSKPTNANYRRGHARTFGKVEPHVNAACCTCEICRARRTDGDVPCVCGVHRIGGLTTSQFARVMFCPICGGLLSKKSQPTARRICPGCRSRGGEHDFGPTCTLTDHERCTRDALTDAPCPTHGYGELDCWCGYRFRAPMVAKALMIITCPVCQRRYEGVEDCCNGHWDCAIEPGTVDTTTTDGGRR